MKKLNYHLLDVFTNKPFGGNQLAVFTDGRGLSSETMQSIAQELKLSETTFVLPPNDKMNHFRVRIFTPTTELPMAGHPTIGTAFVLARENMIERSADGKTVINLEEGIGTVPVRLEWSNNLPPAFIEMEQPLPAFGSRFQNPQIIADMLSLDVRMITDTGLPLEVVSCGVPFLFVLLKDLQAIRSIRFRLDVWEKALRDFETPHVFAFTREVEFQGSDVHSRMFAPAAGISEDPATGGASGPLGCYLAHHKVLSAAEGTMEFVSEQGLEMGRPSFIKIRINQDKGEITQVRVGGQCSYMGQGFLVLS